jgi:hypothetical protein
MSVSASAQSLLLAGWLPGPGLLSNCTRAVIRADRRKLDRWLVTADDLTQLIDGIRQEWGDMESALNAADPQDKSALLTSLGVTVSYDPAGRTARVTCTPRVREKSCRRGDTTVSLTLHSPPSSPLRADAVGGSIGGMPCGPINYLSEVVSGRNARRRPLG